MGAWGSQPFDNDEAGDWSYQLFDGGGPEVVAEGLQDGAGDFEAVAAAAVVARAHGIDVEVPDEVEDWVAAQDVGALTSLAPQAVAALDRVLAGSELAELWDEAGDESWAEDTARLRDGIRAAPWA